MTLEHLNTSKCNHLTPLCSKGLKPSSTAVAIAAVLYTEQKYLLSFNKPTMFYERVNTLSVYGSPVLTVCSVVESLLLRQLHATHLR